MLSHNHDALMKLASKLAYLWAPKRTSASSDAWKGSQLPEQRRDTQSAIRQLLLASHSAPDVFAISQALGTLFRSQGNMEQAITLREDILARHNTSAENQSITYFELGCDYAKAGLIDRAANCFMQANALGYAPATIHHELAKLYTSTGNFISAAKEYATLRLPLEEAFCLVQHAKECKTSGNLTEALSFLAKAQASYPSSPEAWLYTILVALEQQSEYSAESTANAKEYITAALQQKSAAAMLIILEGLLAATQKIQNPATQQRQFDFLFSAMEAATINQNFSLVESYYTGLFALHHNNLHGANHWFHRSLEANPDFWAARLALMQLATHQYTLPSIVQEQIIFLANQATNAKRFMCSPCGMLSNAVYSQCPRCSSWHSMIFRQYLQ